MFKKLFFVAAVAFCAASCFKDGSSYSASYIIDTHFEDLSIFNADSVHFDKVHGAGIGWQGNLGFYHKLNEDKTEFQGGFVLSRLKGKFSDENDRYRVNSGLGYADSKAYAVYYVNPDKSKMPEQDIAFLSSEYGTCTMNLCFVNNTKEVVEAVKSTFGDNDSLTLKMTGYLDGKETGTSEIVLAEYYKDKPDSLMTHWTAMKLDKLGSVDLIRIEMESTKPEIPLAFCMDDMVANVAISY